MTGVLIAAAVFVLVYSLGKRSLGAGVAALLAYGYGYGLVRANLLNPWVHLSFDAGVIGLYLAVFTSRLPAHVLAGSRFTRDWLVFLIGWPCLVFLMPFHHPLVQLVGLRHVTLFLPMLLLGARLQLSDLDQITRWLAALNLLALGVAVWEYFYGIERLFPLSPVTEVLYRSQDIVTSQGLFHRIPATFSSAHSYSGSMLLTLPLLLNGCLRRDRSILERCWFIAACLAALFGIFLSGARSAVLQLGLSVLAVLVITRFSSRIRQPISITIAVLGAILFYGVMRVERLQRFTTLANFDYVEGRIWGSLQFSLLDAIVTYPLGAGLGSAFGSSMPFFLQHLAPEPIGAENEYARIVLEQGVIGLAIWLCFLATFLFRPLPFLDESWRLGLLYMKVMAAIMWGTAFLGTGLLQAIPGSILLLLQMGLLLSVRPERRPRPVIEPAVSHAG
jgi:hypothetical protein